MLTWIENLRLKEPVCIVINDLNCISAPKGKTLYWLPVRLPENMCLICSTNDEEMIANADIRGWNCKEAALFDETETSTFLNNSLRYYGKNLNDRQKTRICRSALMRYPGFLKYIVRFLCVYGSFENLDKLTEDLGAVHDPQEMYAYTIRHMTGSMNEAQKAVAYIVLAILLEILQEEKALSMNERSNDSKIIMQQVSSLFPELELRNGSDTAEQIIGYELYNSLIAINRDQLGESFAKIYDHIPCFF